MDRLTQTSDKGGVAFTFDLDITCKPSEAQKILRLAEKLKQYEDLGTVEELEQAKEKLIQKKPIEQIRLLSLDKGGKCPSCQKYINNNRYWMYCECGQKLDWN